MLPNRLSIVLTGLLIENKYVFTKGKEIVECCLITSEIVDSLKRREGAGVR